MIEKNFTLIIMKTLFFFIQILVRKLSRRTWHGKEVKAPRIRPRAVYEKTRTNGEWDEIVKCTSFLNEIFVYGKLIWRKFCNFSFPNSSSHYFTIRFIHLHIDA